MVEVLLFVGQIEYFLIQDLVRAVELQLGYAQICWFQRTGQQPEEDRFQQSKYHVNRNRQYGNHLQQIARSSVFVKDGIENYVVKCRLCLR